MISLWIIRIAVIGFILLFFWVWYSDAKKYAESKRDKRGTVHLPVVENNITRRNTTKLTRLLNDTPKNPYVTRQFDRRLYEQIMAENEKAKANDYPLSVLSENTENDDFLDKLINQIISDKPDNSVSTVDKKQKHGVLTQRMLLAKEKQTVKAESISIKVPDNLSCLICGYQAKSIRALSGHKKAHSKKV